MEYHNLGPPGPLKVPEFMQKGDHSDYENSTYNIISTVAYLIGVPKRIFDNEHEPPDLSWYERLDSDKNARTVRNLCAVRSALLRHYKRISEEIFYNLKNLHTLPDYLPQEAIRQLEEDGLPIIKANHKINQYLVELNGLVCDRINSCKELFPLWLKWDYIRPLFLMPKGATEAGIKAVVADYSQKCRHFPYQIYLNWELGDEGNVLYNDKKFVDLLYTSHGEMFFDVNNVMDAGNITKNSIYTFIGDSKQTVLIVDCENSDPYKLYAVLRNLKSCYLSKIKKIILYDDPNTTNTWTLLERYVSIPVERELVERVKKSKSLVDIRLTAGACKEFYANSVDSFVIVSSDSDYWGLISALPQARFLVMVEYDHFAGDMRRKLEESGIVYCYIDDFCIGNTGELRNAALLQELEQYLAALGSFNVNDMMRKAISSARIDLSADEYRQFCERYLKNIHVRISEAGEASLSIAK